MNYIDRMGEITHTIVIIINNNIVNNMLIDSIGNQLSAAV